MVRVPLDRWRTGYTYSWNVAIRYIECRLHVLVERCHYIDSVQVIRTHGTCAIR